jgi:hypothetical protein
MLSLLPYLIPPGSLSLGFILLPFASLTSYASFFRLKLAPVGGVLIILDGASWLIATYFLPSTTGVYSSLGPFVLTFGGVVLLISYVLSRLDKLDPSEDLRWD